MQQENKVTPVLKHTTIKKISAEKDKSCCNSVILHKVITSYCVEGTIIFFG